MTRGIFLATVATWAVALSSAAFADSPTKESPKNSNTDKKIIPNKNTDKGIVNLKTTPDENITVVGLRASKNKTIRLRRSSAQVMDSVTSTDIGQLPDFNAGDALKRVAGVNTLSYQGEPRFVIVRGFNANYNDMLIDGFKFAVTDINAGVSGGSGRQVDMNVLPANIAQTIEVTKSAIPSMDGNFIGGLTNFVTPGAFDLRDGKVSLAARGGPAIDSSRNGGSHPTGEASLSGAKRFGKDKQFGFYGSATYWSRDINVPQLEAGSSRYFFSSSGKPTTAYGGNGYAVPANRLLYNYQNHRERYGLQGRLDWRPDDQTSVYLGSYYFHQVERSYRNTLNASLSSSTKASDQTATSGDLSGVSQLDQLGRYRWDRQVYGVYLRGKREFRNGWVLDGGSSVSHSNVNNPQRSDQFTRSGLSFSYADALGVPAFNQLTSGGFNPSAYNSVSVTQERYTLNETDLDEQINLSHNAQANDHGFGIRAGGRYTNTSQNVGYNGTIYTGNAYSLADVLSGSSLCGFECTGTIPIISPSLASSMFQKYESQLTATPRTSSNYGGTYSVFERIAAGYLQLQYQTSLWQLITGVRVEHTDSGSTGYQQTNGNWGKQSAEHSYNSILPSMLLVVNATHNSKIRFGVSKTVARPTYAQSAIHGGSLNTTTTPYTLSTGNPNLKPRSSINFDLAGDYYFDHNRGMFTVSGFAKLLKNEIFSYTEYGSVAGIDEPVLITQARNATKTANVLGLEFNFLYDLNFLPRPLDGFSLLANATISRTRFPLTLSNGASLMMHGLPQQPTQIYNASLIYDKDRYHGRVAWNHLGKLWDDRYSYLSPTNYYWNRFQHSTNNLDIQFSYDITKHASVTFDAQNITGQGMKYTYGKGRDLYQSAWSLPTMLMVGFKADL